MTPCVVTKKPKWILGRRITKPADLYSIKKVAVVDDDGEITVLPVFWAKNLIVKTFQEYVHNGRLYEAVRNTY